MKLDLLTNDKVVDDDIRFASFNKSKDKQKSFLDNSNQDDKESDELDYNDDKDQLEEEQEEKTGETARVTMNQVF